jgi:peptidoglycan/LPS O-acetylase OafA/YrhL
LYIIGFHVFTNMRGSPEILKSIFSHGQIIVQIFFCISGFLISKSFAKRINAENWPIRNFLIRRFFRIIPVWWMILMSFYVFNLINTEVLLVNMFFIFGFIQFNKSMAPVHASWSLFVEEIFYFLYAFLFARSKVIFIAGAFIFSTVFSRVWLNYGGDWGVPTEFSYLYTSPMNHFQYFFLGMLIFNFYESHLRKVFAHKWIFDSTFVLFLLLLGLGIYLPSELYVAGFFLAVLNPLGLSQKLFNSSFLRYAGIRCYFIYIAHGPIRHLINPWARPMHIRLEENPGPENAIIYFFILSTVTFVFSIISFKYLEEPSMKLAERLTKK